MAKITLQGYQCERCKHEWVPRNNTEEEPRVCPRCKSPYWNRPKKDMSEAAKKAWETRRNKSQQSP